MMASSSSEDQQQLLQLQQEQNQQKEPVKEKECLHKTKAIQFLGRTTPIVLQNDNGPCPLLAISNVLLLRNNLHLSQDIAEVSQEKLLSLVAEQLIDSNSNVANKDSGYVENQQQNISDAIDLLPRLTTGIDVNIKFKRINDFEFTPECAIFDVLDIPLYHGWIVDPQDEATANAFGSKSYNALTSELVALETRNIEGKRKSYPEDDCIDFAAATTATLGVPSPCLPKTRSFDESPHAVSGSPSPCAVSGSSSPRAVSGSSSPSAVSDHPTMRKGDLEEEAELLRVMRLSEVESPATDANDNKVSISSNLEESKVMTVDSGITLHIQNQSLHQSETSMPNDSNASSNNNVDLLSFTTIIGEAANSSLKIEDEKRIDQSVYAEIDVPVLCNDAVKKSTVEIEHQTESSASFSFGKDIAPVDSNHSDISRGPEKNSESVVAHDANEAASHPNGYSTTELSSISDPDANSGSSSGRLQHVGALEVQSPNVGGDEPIYEGEERILKSSPATNENQEPVYEGEVTLAERSDKNILDSRDANWKDEITPQQGELIRNFLKNNASQLTFYGLFGLQDGLKERELCVFFRNNHFSTMFKYEGELYLLATDQGYLNEPDLVWEKLNEVNGDTIFMMSNFKEFKVESHATETWDENNVRTSTADYLASIDSASQSNPDMNSDMQLAIALQQQEFEQQPQRQNNVQQSSVTGGSRMVTGPQVPRSANRRPTPPSRPEPKSKDKCTVM